MASEFDGITGSVDWRAKLEELLGEARRAAVEDDVQARVKVSTRLSEFVIRNPPSSATTSDGADYAAMDRIASEAAEAVLLAVVEDRVRRIVGRTTELAVLRKRVDAQTATNASTASTLRLDKAKRVVEATTDVVSVMLDLKNELVDSEDVDDTVIAKKIDALVSRIQKLRSEIETAFY